MMVQTDMTRIGLISDIHADGKGLHRALRLLKNEGAEKILCAGDLIDKGPDGNEVVSCLKEEAIPSVYGNHDYGVIENQQFFRSLGKEQSVWHPSPLNDDTIAYISRLPQLMVHTQPAPRTEDVSESPPESPDPTLLICHGTPWSADIYLFPYTRAELFQRVEREARNFKAGIVIAGHTHVPMMVLAGSVWVLNPGSVCGRYSSGSRTCAILTLPGPNRPGPVFEVYNIDTGREVTPSTTHIK